MLFFDTAKQTTAIACSVAFTVALALCLLFAFSSQFFYMKKTKNYKYLNTDLFFLFFVGFVFFGSAAIVQLWNTAVARTEHGTWWQYYIIRGSWIGVGAIVGLICSYFFLIKALDREEDVVSQVSTDNLPELHSEGEESNEIEGLELSEENVDGDAEPVNEESFVNPALNI